jgi:hypothetical protein
MDELELFAIPTEQIGALFAVSPTPAQRMKARELPEHVLYVKHPDGGIMKVKRVFVEFEQRVPAAFEEEMT